MSVLAIHASALQAAALSHDTLAALDEAQDQGRALVAWLLFVGWFWGVTAALFAWGLA